MKSTEVLAKYIDALTLNYKFMNSMFSILGCVDVDKLEGHDMMRFFSGLERVNRMFEERSMKMLDECMRGMEEEK